MQIFLLILKVLGFLLLGILGILILLISLVLFVPVRYQIAGEVEKDFKFRIKGKASWLLSALTIRFSYIESEFLNEIRIFGIKYKKKEINEEELCDEAEDSLKEASENFLEETAKEDSVQSDVEIENEPEITYSENLQKKLEEKKAEKVLQEDASLKDAKQKEDVSEETKKTDALEDKPQKNKTSDEAQNAADNSEKKQKTAWFQKKLDKIRTSLKELKLKITKFLELFKTGKQKVSDIKALVTDETNKRVAALLWKELKYLLHHFRFRRIDTDLSFGTEDPALTGQILGALCLLPVLYQYNFHLYPDFEAEKLYVSGSFKIVGKVRLIHISATLIRLIKEKEVRAVIKKWSEQN